MAQKILTYLPPPPALLRGQFTMEHVKYFIRYPHVLGHLIGKTKLSLMHSDWIHWMWSEGISRILKAHRGSYKTTAMVVGIIRHMLLHPEDRIGIIRKTFTDASEILEMVKEIMLLPEVQQLFYLVHGYMPRAKIARKEKLAYNFKKISTPEGNINIHGLDGSLTGKHYDIIWGDDFITLKDRLSKAEREKTKEIIRDIVVNIIDPGKPVLLTGTPWAKHDAWEILDFPAWEFTVHQTTVLTQEQIEAKKKLTTPFLWAANYELDITTEAGKIFGDPHYGPWNYQLDTYAHLDCAYDGDHTCALTMMARKSDGRYQGRGWVYPGNVKNWLPEVAKKCRHFRVKMLHIEENPDKGYTADKASQLGIPVHSYWEDQNKSHKISTRLYHVWEKVDWADDGDLDDEYMEQIVDWADGIEPDDAPDSAASLVDRQWSGEETGDNVLSEW